VNPLKANMVHLKHEQIGKEKGIHFWDISVVQGLKAGPAKRHPRNNETKKLCLHKADTKCIESIKISTKQKSHNHHVSSRNHLPALENCGFVVVSPNPWIFHRWSPSCSERKDQAQLEPNKEDNQIINLLTEASHSAQKTWWLVETC